MRSLSERIKTLETELRPGPDRITEIHRRIIRTGDGAIIGLYRSVLGEYRSREITTDKELAEAGYCRQPDGTLMEVENGI